MLVHTLGGLGLSNSSFQRHKPLLLLSYLAIEGEQERYFISKLFWPNAKHARSSLSVALSQIRKIDEKIISSSDKSIKTRLKSDVGILQKRLIAKKYKKVVTNYWGSFVENLNIDMGIELEEWVYKQREHIALQVQDAYLHLAETEAKRQHFNKAAKLTKKACQIKGLDCSETKHQKRIYLLLRAANSSYISKLEDCDFNIGFDEARAHFLSKKSKLL